MHERDVAAEEPDEPAERPEHQPRRLLAPPEGQRNDLGEKCQRQHRAADRREPERALEAAGLAVAGDRPVNGPVFVANRIPLGLLRVNNVLISGCPA